MPLPNVFVRPTRAGLIVREPTTGRPIPADGALVVDSSFWRRRQRDGDVTIESPPAPNVRPSARSARPRSEGETS